MHALARLCRGQVLKALDFALAAVHCDIKSDNILGENGQVADDWLARRSRQRRMRMTMVPY